MVLHWLDDHRGETVVVKFGGNAMVDDSLASTFAADIVALHNAGLRVVVTHGGGPQISRELERRGIASEFRGGLRYTSEDAVLAVHDVLLALGQDLATRVGNAGGDAVAVPGYTSALFTATRRGTVVDGEKVDLGQVGEVSAVDPRVLSALLDAGRIPVVSAIAHGNTDSSARQLSDSGHLPRARQLLNINADSAAGSLAAALRADWLILLTDVAGLYRDWPRLDSLVDSLTLDELDELLPQLVSGMIPKMEACRTAVAGGACAAAVIDGREPHALLSAPFGVGGTTVRNSEKATA
ncbi:MAG: acetylglutamate kinase [Terrimesophilobacter sp.]